MAITAPIGGCPVLQIFLGDRLARTGAATWSLGKLMGLGGPGQWPVQAWPVWLYGDRLACLDGLGPSPNGTGNKKKKMNSRLNPFPGPPT